jgi:hypothetical protein
MNGIKFSYALVIKAHNFIRRLFTASRNRIEKWKEQRPYTKRIMKRIWKFSAVEFSLLMIFNGAVSACELCRAQVASEIYDRDFFDNLLVMLLPVIITTAIGLGLYHADKLQAGWKAEQNNG